MSGRWQRFVLVLKVVEVRLRFVAILAATGLAIGYWDAIKNRWDKWTRPAAPAAAQVASDFELYCPMDPQVVRPGLEPDGSWPNCPVCGMRLAQRKRGGSVPLPPGVTGRVQLSPERIRLAGVRTEEVAWRSLEKEIATVGFVTYDESRLSRIVARASGFLEKLYVNKTFVPVKEGEPLAEIDSPDLSSALQDLLVVLRNPPAGSDLVAAAREKVRLLGLSDREIDEIARSGKARSRLLIRSPQSGHVIQRAVVRGAHVERGATLFDVADLSTVWIEAEVYEKDIPFLREGQAISATVEAFPARVFSGTIALVHPHLETATRTNTARFTMENPKHDLRPGMFATVRIATPLEEIEPFRTLAERAGPRAGGRILAVPERAVIDTGSKKIVYVERDSGVFDGVLVELGPRVGSFYPVIAGLEQGQRVASAGSFLIDAETRLNPAAASAFVGAGPGAGTGAGAGAGAKKPAPEELQNLAKLAPADRAEAEAQGLCPVSDDALGGMGVPYKMLVRGRVVFLCCENCVPKVTADPEKALRRVDELKAARARAGGGR